MALVFFERGKAPNIRELKEKLGCFGPFGLQSALENTASDTESLPKRKKCGGQCLSTEDVVRLKQNMGNLFLPHSILPTSNKDKCEPEE